MAKGLQTVLAGTVVLGLVFSAGCNRASSSPVADTPAKQQAIPFHDAAQHGSSVEAPTPRLPDGPNSTALIPFRGIPRDLPAGTFLTVRLEQSLTGTKVHAGDTFTAAVVDPVTVDGRPVIDRGADAVGLVEAIRVVGMPRNARYLSLVLDSVRVNGKELPVQTSTLLAKAVGADGENLPSAPPSQHGRGIRLRKGRVLTFRLTAPLSMEASQNTDQGSGSGSK